MHRRHPLADVAIDPHQHGIWIDPAIIGEARAAVEALELVALDGTPAPGPKAFGAEQLGTCEHDRIWIKTPTGPGCVEPAAITEAMNVIETGVPQRMTYGITDEDACAVGLTCGGTVHLMIERIDW